MLDKRQLTWKKKFIESKYERMMYFPRFIYANTQYICTEKDSKMRREGEGGLRH